MIKKLLFISDVGLAAIVLSTTMIADSHAQAPTPVNCVQGCSSGGTFTVNNITGGTVTTLQGGSWTVTATAADPCVYATKSNVPISYVTTTSIQLVGLSTGKLIYVCSLALIGSTATVFSLTSGTGTACSTTIAAVMGAATATNGMSLTSNGGMTLGSGAGTIAIAPASSELCMIQSGSGTLAGNLTFVQQ